MTTETEDNVQGDSPQDTPPGTTATPRTRTPRRRTRAKAADTQTAESQSADAPTADAPTGDAPTAETPRRRTRAKAADAPTADAPTGDTPTADAPTVDAPTVDAPTAETPRRRTRAKASDALAADAPAAKSKAPVRRRSTTRKSAQPEAEPAKTAPIRARPRLQEKLRSEVGPILIREFGYTSPMQVPVLRRIALNIGLGEALDNPRAMENATRDLTLISGQRPITTRARKSIAGFKIREGMPIGLSVTLRGRRMYEFMDRLVSSALPRIRDFQGVSREAFDGRGNYSLGIREQIIFPEVDYNSIDRIRGLQVVIVTGARTDREGFRLLELLGMPFARSRSMAEVSGN